MALGAVEQEFGRGKAVFLALLPPQQSSDAAGARVTCPLRLRVNARRSSPALRGTGCRSCSVLLQGLLAVQVAGCKGWSHLVRAWACTPAAEG